MKDIGKCHAVTNAQQNDVFQLPDGTFLWIGDQWQTHQII